MSQIHDDVARALKELQDEAKNLESVAGHELIALYDSLNATLSRIRAAKLSHEHEDRPIESGSGAITDDRHPEAVAGEPQPRSKEDIESQAAREPDPKVREKLHAEAQAAEKRSSSKK